MTIDVCEAKGGGRSQASRGRSNYYGAGDEGKKFYKYVEPPIFGL